ncbi:MAG: hypothetical protein M1832_005213 [Thelocarpon impressellum]|nr:MAG: hypothetical protein M1832_005213 [Thelocarpon impressellum]
MAPPAPPVAIRDPCSVIHDGTLYVYTQDAFQSIPLSEGGEWTRLPSNASITGATCVKAAPGGDESNTALFLVGGSTDVNTNYPGLSMYSFSQKRWTNCEPEVQVTQNRKNHGATYLNASASILIFAGSQDSSAGNVASSQTFLVSTVRPFSVTSYNSRAPPVVRPVVLPWNETHAAMLGGDPGNRKVYTFSKEQGWTDTGIKLDASVPDQVEGIILNGDDGSKVLQTFDMTRSPNTVTNTVLENPRGEGAPPGKMTSGSPPPAGRRRSGPPPAKRRKRDLTLADWPAYNGTLAPRSTRDSYSIAAADGEVVAVGGNNDDPLCIFNARENSWVDATKRFLGDRQSPTTSSAPSATKSSDPTATPAAAASPANADRSRRLTILGATLGSLFGLAIILAIILLCLKQKRRKARTNKASRRADGTVVDEKDRLSFADRGASFMSEAGGFVRHGPKDSTLSTSSTAIISGRDRKDGQDGYPARDDGVGSIPPGPSDVEGRDVSSAPVPPSPTRDGSGRQRSSGWSRYFSGHNFPGTELAHMNSTRSAKTAQTLSSHYEDDAAAAGALDRSSSQRALNPAGGATTPARPPGSASGRPGNTGREYSSSTNSSGGQEDAFGGGLPPSIHEDTQWTPVDRQDWASKRAASSVYTSSAHGSMVPRDASAGPLFPRNSSHGSFLGAMHPQTSAPVTSVLRDSSPESSTTFPRAGGNIAESDEYQDDMRPGHSDMSWLNLGGSSKGGTSTA